MIRRESILWVLIFENACFVWEYSSLFILEVLLVNFVLCHASHNCLSLVSNNVRSLVFFSQVMTCQICCIRKIYHGCKYWTEYQTIFLSGWIDQTGRSSPTFKTMKFITHSVCVSTIEILSLTYEFKFNNLRQCLTE